MKYLFFWRSKGTPAIYLFKPFAQLFEKQVVCFSAVSILVNSLFCYFIIVSKDLETPKNQIFQV